MPSTAPPQTDVDHRLPTSVRPTHYDLTVRTDLVHLKFDGIVKIDLDIKEETPSLVFNTHDLQLGDIIIYSDALRSEQTPSATSFDATAERGVLSLSVPLPAGSKSQVRINFEGQLTGSLLGYYRCAGGADGKEVYSLTQFEPVAARRAFPCWDEPALKATFAVTLISRTGTVNLSNMPAVSETIYNPGFSTEKDETLISWLSSKLSSANPPGDLPPADEWKITRFETSPPMSTYLVAYANGRFEYIESSYTSPLSGRTRPLRFYATPDVIHQAQFALDVKRQVLPIYEKAFEIEYPLPKLDSLVASDFDAGAMENWGLIMARTAALLIDPKSENLRIKKRIAGTMCHEVAHMWFGDITTMEWWDNLYLNEGFATLMAKVTILDRVFPEWNLDAMFITESLSIAFGLDAKPSSHPVEVECPDAGTVNEIFDALSYHKAASILRMLSAYVGEEKFLKGVSLYLKKHLFANSTTKDLWDGISAATGVDISKLMNNWIKKIGYPVVTVTETPEGIHIRQDRFLETGPAKAEDNETIWSIPLSLLTVSDSGDSVINREVLLDEREKTIHMNTKRPFKLNAGTVSFYRVLYSKERLVSIGVEAAKIPTPFSVKDRVGLVYDAFALSKAGFASVSSALSLAGVLRNETEYTVWESIRNNVRSIRSVWWEHPAINDAIARFERELFSPIVERLGFDNRVDDSSDDRALRISVIQEASAVDEERVVEELTSRFAHFLQTGDDSRIPADLTGVIYATAVRVGGREEWELVKKIAKNPKNTTTGIAAMNAMCHQDLLRFVSALSINTHTRRFLATAFKEHYDEFAERLDGNFSMRYLVKSAFDLLSSDKDYEDLTNFFKDKDTYKFDMALKQTLDNIASRAAWIKRSTAEIEEWARSR